MERVLAGQRGESLGTAECLVEATISSKPTLIWVITIELPQEPTNEGFLTQTGEFLRVAVHLVCIEGLPRSNPAGGRLMLLGIAICCSTHAPL